MNERSPTTENWTSKRTTTTSQKATHAYHFHLTGTSMHLQTSLLKAGQNLPLKHGLTRCRRRARARRELHIEHSGMAVLSRLSSASSSPALEAGAREGAAAVVRRRLLCT